MLFQPTLSRAHPLTFIRSRSNRGIAARALPSCSCPKGDLQPRANPRGFSTSGAFLNRFRTRLRAGGTAAPAPAPADDPVSKFGARLLYWNDPSDLTVTHQDSGRTTGAAVDSPVGSRLNKGTLAGYAVQAVSGKRPTLKQDGSGFYYDRGDVLDDFLSIALALAGETTITVVCGVVKESDAAAGVAIEFGNITNAAGSFGFSAPNTTAATTFAFTLRGSSLGAYIPSTFAAPQSRVLRQTLSIGAAALATEILPYVDGVLSQSGPSGTAGTGTNFVDGILYELMRAGTSVPMPGGIYQRMIISGAITTDEAAWVDTWTGAKMGKTL